MRVARGVLLKKVWPVSILILISGLIILFVPPTGFLAILLLVTVLSLVAGLLVKLFTTRKFAFIVTVFVFTFLILLGLDLLDPVNIALAISLLAGVAILVK